MTRSRVAIIGTGRVGQSLARALGASGTEVRVVPRTADAATRREAVAAAPLLVFAVADDAIPAAAEAFAGSGAAFAGRVALHCSGLRDRSALAPLGALGAACGSWHPLQTFSDGEGGLERFRGAPAIVEGDPAAVAAARALAERLGMAPVVELAAAGKAAYHAAAVLASGGVVALMAVAERLARGAGVPADAARTLYLPLLERTVANIVAAGPAAALTGPVARGDEGTIAAHRAALGEADRALYAALIAAARPLVTDR